MDISQFPGRKNSQNAGRAPDKALGTKSMLHYVIIVLKKKVIFFSFSNLPPYVPTSQGPDAGIGRRRWPGTLQGTH
ncbi:unnamed protein product, partial [Staurois parvus]